jgi:general secretion pathway protein G
MRQNQTSSIINNRGMTLVEIMIVLAILGAIMSLLLPKIVGGQDKAKVREAKIQIGQISNSLSMYKLDCNKYPATLGGLVANDGCSNWGPEAYYKVPKGQEGIKDPWQNDLVYSVEGGEYVLKALGKDGAEGGDGYNTDISSEDL